MYRVKQCVKNYSGFSLRLLTGIFLSGLAQKLFFKELGEFRAPKMDLVLIIFSVSSEKLIDMCVYVKGIYIEILCKKLPLT